MRVRLAVLIGLVVVAVGLAACGGDDDSGGGGSGGGDSGGSGSVQGDGKELVMFTMTASNVYGANQIKGAKEEAEKLGYKLTVFEHNFSQPEQDQQVQQYIASGAKPAAIIFWPWVADAAINDVRQLSQLAPGDPAHPGARTSSPGPSSRPIPAPTRSSSARPLGEMMLQAREARARPPA